MFQKYSFNNVVYSDSVLRIFCSHRILGIRNTIGHTITLLQRIFTPNRNRCQQ